MNKSIEKKIAENENKYRQIAQSLIETIWVIDPKNLTFLYISPDAYEARGYTQAELIEKPIDILMSPQSAEKHRKAADKALKNFNEGKSSSYKTEVELIRKNKTKTWVEISAKIVRDDDKNLKIVGISKEINQRKKTEKEKEDVVAELREALKEKEKLIKHVKELESLLPICSGCRRIRDKNKKWWPLESYIEEKSNSRFTHTVCPDCRDIIYKS
ncbi:MAG: PAS domain S-box protein [Thermodesulfobacteriota bacterium]